MGYRIGDRFRRYSDWEIIGTIDGNGEYLSMCVKSSSAWKIGETAKRDFSKEEGWEYLGNFSKTSNFEELYNLLNGTD